MRKRKNKANSRKDLVGVQHAIDGLLDFFCRNPKAFHTESDVKCYLYGLLLKTVDAQHIHTEKTKGKGRYDIAIEYEGGISKVIIEMKFNPNVSKSLKWDPKRNTIGVYIGI